MQDAEENVRGSEVVKTEHISVIEDALFWFYNICKPGFSYGVQSRTQCYPTLTGSSRGRSG